MGRNTGDARVLIYSHDTFGLGHLRRCRTIAHSLVARTNRLSVLILSGSPIIGSFDFASRVDFVRVPGVIKLRNGEYSSSSLDLDIAEVVDMRASIVRHTAEVFDPDVFVVDKEPARPSWRDPRYPAGAEASRHAPGARPARCHGRPRRTRYGVAAQEPGAGAA